MTPWRMPDSALRGDTGRRPAKLRSPLGPNESARRSKVPYPAGLRPRVSIKEDAFTARYVDLEGVRTWYDERAHGLLVEKAALCNSMIVDFLANEAVETLAPIRRATRGGGSP